MFRETLAHRPFPIRVSIPGSGSPPATAAELVETALAATTNPRVPERRAVLTALLIPDDAVVVWDRAVADADASAHQHHLVANEAWDGWSTTDWWRHAWLRGATASPVTATVVLLLDRAAD